MKNDIFWSHFEVPARVQGSGNSSAMSKRTRLTGSKEGHDQEVQCSGYGALRSLDCGRRQTQTDSKESSEQAVQAAGYGLWPHRITGFLRERRKPVTEQRESSDQRAQCSGYGIAEDPSREF